MPGAYIYAWDSVGGKWVKVLATAITGKLKVKAG